jgi:hypothetical protein
MSAAIFFQKSKAKQDEFKLIELVTIREKCVGQLQSIIRDVKEARLSKKSPKVLLRVLKLFIEVRESTINLLLAISVWQETFTKPIRPQLMDCDYIVDRIVNHIDFVNSSHVRKMLNFQILRGNVLLLPFPKNDVSTIIKSGRKVGRIDRTSLGVSSQNLYPLRKNWSLNVTNF